jgi:hypothetical protein
MMVLKMYLVFLLLSRRSRNQHVLDSKSYLVGHTKESVSNVGGDHIDGVPAGNMVSKSLSGLGA